MPRTATQTGDVVHPATVIHATWQGAAITLEPHNRLRANHPLVKQLGAGAFVPERALDFED